MDLWRAPTRRPVKAYDQAVGDVLGSPNGRHPDTLALTWAHQIAWAAHGGPGLDELERLSATAARYDVPLDAVLDERRRQEKAPPVVPAHRPAIEPKAPLRKFSRPA